MSHLEIIQKLGKEYRDLADFLEENYQNKDKNFESVRTSATNRQEVIKHMVLVLAGCDSVSDSPLFWPDELRHLTGIKEVKVFEWLKS